MIVTCEKCSKKFNIDDNLIPDEGRELQCGSCNYKWFYKKNENAISLKNEISESLSKNYDFEYANNDLSSKKLENLDKAKYKDLKKPSVDNKIKKKPKIIKNSLVFVISVIALIVLLDTFKYQLNYYFPELDSILNNLYESLKDLSLFFKDLIN
tara:strand:- start:1783 stop:2244 length:462 start_codon:yes stop_codon:yes gene_type:complete